MCWLEFDGGEEWDSSLQEERTVQSRPTPSGRGLSDTESQPNSSLVFSSAVLLGWGLEDLLETINQRVESGETLGYLGGRFESHYVIL